MKKELYCYIHIPFCDLKCKYCRFASIWAFQDKKIEIYVNNLLKEIGNKNSLVKSRGFFDDRILKSIYFGWWTPSVLKIDLMEKILNKLKKEFIFDKNIEITIESTPNNVVLENVISWQKLWINRLSIWVQTLNSDSLIEIWRWNKWDIINALELLKQSNFDNVSLDFIIWLPFVKTWEIKQNLDFLLSRYDFIKHISSYMLEEYYNKDKLIQNKFDNIVYPESWKNTWLDEKLYLKEYCEIVDFLKERWFSRYEISNFAKQNYECKHNKSYWNHSEVVSFWLSASSFLDKTRFTNSDDFSAYYNKKDIFQEKLDKTDIFLEKIMFDLRTSWIKKTDFKKLNEEKINYFMQNNYLKLEDDLLKLENKWVLVLDYILSEII